MGAYYNEIDPFPAQWLRNLIRAGHIAEGEVDERSIEELEPEDVAMSERVHLFAGIGGWDLALQIVGWPPERPIWTASCPCQPFSSAGRRRGVEDERHLWPQVARLVQSVRPPLIVGEQVASPDGIAWLDTVFDDLEAAGYTCRAADLCAASVSAPHIRQRLWWRADRVADGVGPGLEGHPGHGHRKTGRTLPPGPAAARSGPGGLADPHQHQQRSGRGSHGQGSTRDGAGTDPSGRGGPGGLANPGRSVLQPWIQTRDDAGPSPEAEGEARERKRGGDGDRCGGPDGDPDPRDIFPRGPDWLWCRDGRWRPVEPGSFPLADGLPGGMVQLRAGNTTHRAGALKGLGNAIVPQVAAAFLLVTEMNKPPGAHC